MSDRAKQILEAIRDWPPAEIEELVKDLQRRLQPEPSAAYKEWIKTAAGAGLPGVTTEEIMSLTRGE